MLDIRDRIVVTGAAGLVGQNLVALLREEGFSNIVAIDKHEQNLATLARLHPGLETLRVDLAEPGAWEQSLDDAAVLVMLQAQITGLTAEPFVRNNLTASERVLAAARERRVRFLVHASSSVVNSVADDDYTRTKRAQEELVMKDVVPYCILRPTLMFGWFDPKHLGWLSRFMEKVPVFPIPGHGRYMRQPLYNRDFCRAILSCMREQPAGAVYDLVGPDRIDYIDMIKAIREVKGLKTPIVRIPYGLFDALLKLYAMFSAKPPFTAGQLKALTAGDEFTGVDMEATFGFKPTPFREALHETFTHPVYSQVELESPH
jgi:nucleoside-diphosphate-sugar epimerase